MEKRVEYALEGECCPLNVLVLEAMGIPTERDLRYTEPSNNKDLKKYLARHE